MHITVGTSGTGGGFEKFCAGETDISDASRPIEEDEIAGLQEERHRLLEIQVANDGIAVVTNKDLKVDCLTTDQLKELWNKGSKVSNLSEIDPRLPTRAQAVRAGHRLRHVRLLHRADQR